MFDNFIFNSMSFWMRFNAAIALSTILSLFCMLWLILVGQLKLIAKVVCFIFLASVQIIQIVSLCHYNN